ncbi:MAG: sulfatase-like hydrolase/transferase [Bacteroidales bacterium]|nr:sulfatase-like hydrolase/transferase [Bacteroidales bacterium]
MRKKHFYPGNILTVLLIRLLIVLFFLTLSRIMIFFFNLSYWDDLSFNQFITILIYGVRFDISTLCIIATPYIFFNTIPFHFRNNKTFQALNNLQLSIFIIIAFMLNFIDVIYVRFTGKRMTGDIFSILGAGDDYIPLFIQFLKDFWFPLFLWIIFSTITIFLIHSVKISKKKPKLPALAYYLINTIWFLIFSFFTIIGIRGGFQLRPVSIINAGEYTNAKNTPLVLNTPFSIAKTYGKPALNYVEYFPDEGSLNNIYTPLHNGFKPGSHFTFPDSADRNVVIIIMESFSTEHIGSLNKKASGSSVETYTPFLDSIIEVSLAFNGYANGKRSIEAIPAVLAGLPALMNESYITSGFSGNKINSLASLLDEKGYTSAFYHGGNNGTMGFEPFIKMAGFDKYYGRNEYNDDSDFDGKWGIFDEPYFQYVSQMLDNTPEPFLATIMSLSSHHPYTIPEQHQGRFPKGPLEIHESIGYADYSLQRFFQSIKEMDWFSNTLFIITADHTSEAYSPQYQNPVGMYRIPIVFYIPGEKMKAKESIIVQQTDIMPSILQLLDYDLPFIAFGESVFDFNAQQFSITFLNGTYQLIKDNYVLQWDGEKNFSQYNILEDPGLQHNLAGIEDSATKNNNYFLKAIIQQYNNRLIKNNLTAD